MKRVERVSALTIALFFGAAAILSFVFQQNGSAPPLAAWAPGLVLLTWRYGAKPALGAVCVVMMVLAFVFAPGEPHSPFLELSVTIPFACMALITVFATQYLRNAWRRVCDHQRHGDEIRSLLYEIIEGR